MMRLATTTVFLASLVGLASSFMAPTALLTRSSTRQHHKSGNASTRLRMEVQVGSQAPKFRVKDQNGFDVTLQSFYAKNNVVVYFYPKDSTSGCTKEASTFRDLKSEYDALDAVILGVSADDQESHRAFIAELGLNFSLLADTNMDLVKSYGAVKAEDDTKIQRSTVLVDKEGRVVAVWNPVTEAEKHPADVLDKLKEISAAPERSRMDRFISNMMSED